LEINERMRMVPMTVLESTMIELTFGNAISVKPSSLYKFTWTKVFEGGDTTFLEKTSWHEKRVPPVMPGIGMILVLAWHPPRRISYQKWKQIHNPYRCPVQSTPGRSKWIAKNETVHFQVFPINSYPNKVCTNVKHSWD